MMTTNGSFTQQDQYKNSNEHCSSNFNPTDNTIENTSPNNLTKDEVGWYFVEQFYTTLSKSPEKLHLFYGATSQFVFGLEAEVSPVSVGRDAIQERIKELDFHDFKVRVSNVDAQGSHNCIVIQVIGETSSLSAEPRKFVQTFVLAQQPTGYFVLNDIFRYITEDLEDEAIESKIEDTIADASLVEENQEAPKESAITKELPSNSLDIEVEDVKSDKSVESEPSRIEPFTTNGTSIDDPPAPTVPIVDEEPNYGVMEEIPQSMVTEKPSEELKDSKQTTDSSSVTSGTNAQYPSKPTPAAQQHGSSKTLSWASRAAAAVGSTPKPAVPVVTSRNTISTQNRAISSASKSIPVTNAAANTQNEKEKEKEKENVPIGSGWQTAGENQKKQNRPTSMSTLPEKECTMGYVRNVTEKVEIEELRTALSAFGVLIYFDINRQKNCAFVEYATTEGYQAANSASPHLVCGESVYVEPRRLKANNYGGNGFAGGRGGMNQRGRSGYGNRNRGSGAFRGRTQSNNA